LSGDGGWNLGVVDMARELASMDALVVGIDITHYLRVLNQQKEGCLYPASDFESLSKYIQKRLEYPDYVRPLLVGYSSGATLIYAALVQAPANTFKGALSLGFCPDLPMDKEPCKGSGLEYTRDARKSSVLFLPAKQLATPWVAFQGEIDQVCNAENTRAFVRRVDNADIVMLPKVGHGFSVARNWLPQFRQVFQDLVKKSGESSQKTNSQLDLPVIEVPVKQAAGSVMAIVLSGDGGWAGLDREVAAALSDNGVGVVGFDSLKYFWTARTPDTAAGDLARLIDHYLDIWQKKSIVLVGYSLGADVLPFMVARLPVEMQRKIRLIALLAPGRQTAFEFHLSDWIGGSGGRDLLPVGPEVRKLGSIPLLCFYGKEEIDSLCNEPLPSNVTVLSMAGSHHLGGNYGAIVARILQALDTGQAKRP
jgi:type IV secretory pathway VirJ component